MVICLSMISSLKLIILTFLLNEAENKLQHLIGGV